MLEDLAQAMYETSPNVAIWRTENGKPTGIINQLDLYAAFVGIEDKQISIQAPRKAQGI